MARAKNIVNTEQVEWRSAGHEPKFGHARKALAASAGGEKLGCSLFRLEPGKAAFPAHVHYANEEAIYVLEGAGILRLGDETHPVAAGDYIALPVGGRAHQMVNSSGQPLLYLCMSTMIQPEVVEMPDSGKVGAMAGSAPGGDKSRRRFFKLFHGDSDVDYFEGE